VIQRRAQITRPRRNSRKITPDGDQIFGSAGSRIDLQRFIQPYACESIVAAPELEQAEVVEHEGGIGVVRFPSMNRERLGVATRCGGEVPIGGGGVGEIQQCRRCGIRERMSSRQRQRCVVVHPRTIGVAERRRQQAEIVVHRGGTAGVAHLRLDRKSTLVQDSRTGEISTILGDVAERDERIRRGPAIADRLRQSARAIEPGFRAVELSADIEASPDVAERSGHRRRVADGRRHAQRATPDDECRIDAIAAEQIIACATNAVDGDACDPLPACHARESFDLPHGKRVFPRDRIGTRRTLREHQGGVGACPPRVRGFGDKLSNHLARVQRPRSNGFH